MFHATLLMLSTCLCTLYVIFVHFLEQPINKMPKCQLLFSAVFGFRNPSKEIFSELDEIKAQGPIFPWSFQKTEEHTKWGHEVATPRGGVAQGGPRRPMVWPPRLAPDSALPP